MLYLKRFSALHSCPFVDRSGFIALLFNVIRRAVPLDIPGALMAGSGLCRCDRVTRRRCLMMAAEGNLLSLMKNVRKEPQIIHNV